MRRKISHQIVIDPVSGALRRAVRVAGGAEQVTRAPQHRQPVHGQAEAETQARNKASNERCRTGSRMGHAKTDRMDSRSAKSSKRPAEDAKIRSADDATALALLWWRVHVALNLRGVSTVTVACDGPR